MLCWWNNQACLYFNDIIFLTAAKISSSPENPINKIMMNKVVAINVSLFTVPVLASQSCHCVRVKYNTMLALIYLPYLATFVVLKTFLESLSV